MSNAGQAISSVIGATIGFAIGGVPGAVKGPQLGLRAEERALLLRARDEADVEQDDRRHRS